MASTSAKRLECTCRRCNPRPPREPGTAFGTTGIGEWHLLNTYFPQFFEERWQHWMEREAKRKAQREEREARTCDVCGKPGARYFGDIDLKLCAACYQLQGGQPHADDHHPG